MDPEFLVKNLVHRSLAAKYGNKKHNFWFLCLSDSKTQFLVWVCAHPLLKTSGMDPGFWSRGPSRVLTQGWGPEPKMCSNMCFLWKLPENCFIVKRILGAGGLGPQAILDLLVNILDVHLSEASGDKLDLLAPHNHMINQTLGAIIQVHQCACVQSVHMHLKCPLQPIWTKPHITWQGDTPNLNNSKLYDLSINIFFQKQLCKLLEIPKTNALTKQPGPQKFQIGSILKEKERWERKGEREGKKVSGRERERVRKRDPILCTETETNTEWTSAAWWDRRVDVVGSDTASCAVSFCQGHSTCINRCIQGGGGF